MTYPLFINSVDDLISPRERDNCITYDDGLLNYIGLDFPITQFDPLNYTYAQKAEMSGYNVKMVFRAGNCIYMHVLRLPNHLHNMNGPAVLQYDVNGKIKSAEWIVDNKLRKTVKYLDGEILSVEQYE